MSRTNCSVNLVPVAHYHVRIRTRRRTAWIGVCATLGLLFAIGWGIQRVATRALARVSHEVTAFESQRAGVQRRLAAIDTQRATLAEQLETFAAARRPQPWARRLVELTREAPDGVFLTTMTVGAATNDHGGGRAERMPRGPRPVSPPPGEQTPAESGPAQQSVRLRGYALDHPALLQFFNSVRRLPSWEQVELVRATQESYRGGQAIAFELDCRTQEDQP